MGDLYHKPSEFPEPNVSILVLIKLIMIRVWTKDPKEPQKKWPTLGGESRQKRGTA